MLLSTLRKDQLIEPSLARLLLITCLPGLRRMLSNEKVASTVSVYLSHGLSDGGIWKLFNIVEV